MELVSLGLGGEAVGFLLLRLVRQLRMDLLKRCPQAKALKLREGRCLPRLSIKSKCGYGYTNSTFEKQTDNICKKCASWKKIGK